MAATTTSVTLLERLQGRPEPEAWARFVQLYTPLLYHWSRGLGLRDQDAADLVQDVFVVLLQKMPSFKYDATGSFRGWLRTVTHNKWRDKQRRLSAHPPEAPDVALSDLASPPQSDVFEETEYRRQLFGRALQLLEPEFQPTSWRAFLEHGMRGRPASEVAAELGLSVGAVYAAKFRVVSRLRESLQGLLD